MKNNIVVFDTDLGIDDVFALVCLKQLNVKIDYIISTCGNSRENIIKRNSVLIQKYLNLEGKLVYGYSGKVSEEKSNFHGEDGLANLGESLSRKLNIKGNLDPLFISIQELKEELKDSLNITYIVTGPLFSLSSILDDKNIKAKIKKLYVMGGGLTEFNCAHNSEFNFSKDPVGLRKMLESNIDITLFPLDLTNHQYFSISQIEDFEKTGRYNELVTMLKYNAKSNEIYNNIHGAVMHDSMPVLYFFNPNYFEVKNANIISDEYGHIEEVKTEGHKVRIATKVDSGIIYSVVEDFFGG